jgi:hypothetical protein
MRKGIDGLAMLVQAVLRQDPFSGHHGIWRVPEVVPLEQENKNPRHKGGCFYCGSAGPFSDEHVVCAGLGGDDSAWMLRGCVCRVCDADIFSKLETKFLRSSPVALARLFLQPRTRNRGGKTDAPSVQPKASYVRDPATGILLEAVLGPAATSKILPQLVIVDAQQVAVTGPDADSAAAFLVELQKTLSGGLDLIEKTRAGFEVSYEVTPLTWNDGAYEPVEARTFAQPPKGGMWVEPLIRPETTKDGEVLLPRIYRQPKGQLVCRIGSVEHAASFLTLLRSAPELLDAGRLGASGTTQAQPGFHQRYIIDMAAHDRVLAKIGLNLVAKLLGLNLIRKPAFDAAIAYAREGKGGVYKLPLASSQQLTDMLGPPLAELHVFALHSHPGPNGAHGLVFMARLYGGLAQAFRLADFEAPIPGLERPIMVLVDYVNHRIKHLTSKRARSRNKGAS